MNKVINVLSFLVILALIVLGIYTHMSNQIISFEEFSASVVNGDSTLVVGVYQESKFALEVVQQPEGDFGFLPDTEDALAQLNQAFNLYGNIGLAAHNNKAGKYIAELEPGDIVQIIYGDGTVREFRISEVRRYQAITIGDQYSDFRDLSEDQLLSSTELFEKVYGGDDRVTFQTCISKEGESSWGRIFFIGFPIE